MEIKEGKLEPKAGDYGLDISEFWEIVFMMLEEKLIRGASISRGGKTNMVIVVNLKRAEVTPEGLEYLADHRDWVGTYPGLREVRAWL